MPSPPDVQALVKAAVEAAVRPLRDKIARLEKTDEQHNGIHRELKTGIRQSQSDIKAEVDDKVTALQTRDQQLIEAFHQMGDRVTNVVDQVALLRASSLVEVTDKKSGTTSMVPAAPVAAAAATKAADSAANANAIALRSLRSINWVKVVGVLWVVLQAIERLAPHLGVP